MLQIIDSSFSVIVDGKPVKVYSHEGRQFFCAEPGKKFQLKFRTPRNKRILAIITVDGLNILTGLKASRNDNGYVIDEGGGTIDGWRTSNEKVNEFVFSSKGESYSVKGGEGTQTGVIACAFYAEKEKPPVVTVTSICNCHGNCYRHTPTWYPNQNLPSVVNCGGEATMDWCEQSSCPNTASLSGLRSATTSKNYRQSSFTASSASVSSVGSLGTAFGKEKESHVTSTTFDRGEKICEQVEYYDTRENLRAMGIPTDELPRDLPSGFPEDDNQFCKPPKK